MSAQLELRLPDGSIRKVDPGTTVAEVAHDIGPGLAKAAVAGVINDEIVETSRPIESGGAFRILTAKNDEALHVLRHSAAHLLAMAVLELFPGWLSFQRCWPRRWPRTVLPRPKKRHPPEWGRCHSEPIFR